MSVGFVENSRSLVWIFILIVLLLKLSQESLLLSNLVGVEVEGHRIVVVGSREQTSSLSWLDLLKIELELGILLWVRLLVAVDLDTFLLELSLVLLSPHGSVHGNHGSFLVLVLALKNRMVLNHSNLLLVEPLLLQSHLLLSHGSCLLVGDDLVVYSNNIVLLSLGWVLVLLRILTLGLVVFLSSLSRSAIGILSCLLSSMSWPSSDLRSSSGWSLLVWLRLPSSCEEDGTVPLSLVWTA